MTNGCGIILTGVGGYGNVYLRELLRLHRAGELTLIAAADPDPSTCLHLKQLREIGVPLYPSLRDCLAAQACDLTIIAAPAHCHADLTCEALASGSHVLCEKPLASSMEDLLRMEAAESASLGSVAVGYQWSFTDPVQQCKRDILEGKFGRAIRAKTIAASPRGAGYFQRVHWAGRIKTAEGQWVLDSPLHNAHSHHLHNMLYLLGETRETADFPNTVRAELFRANSIENYDTAALRCLTDRGVEVLFYTTHASSAPLGPIMRIEFEHATVKADLNINSSLTVEVRDGAVHDYGELCEYPNADYFNKISHSIDARQGGLPPACGIAAALPQALCALAAQRSADDIITAPSSMLGTCDAESGIVIRGIEEMFMECFERNCLPGELERPALTCPSRTVHVRGEIMAGAHSESLH